ncbi:MAG: cysteine methyltransferase [Anaerolineae bacterium SG8_19]|jgi:O-6-methylguanine DNA methyltransferase|nr:MAG: cysteine methyltransferase [Anaerolineae bacterium SG8_19]HCB50766.1 cysteine methyltransferase [Chloroflexota bacterium]
MAETYLGIYQSPIGLIEIKVTAGAIISLEFVEEVREEERLDPIVEEAIRQLSAYFDGTRRDFDLPISPQGTDFQRLVWQHLLDIPFGQIISYQDLAKAIGKPEAIRAVGAANGQNPISIVVPCHRVLGSDGSLTGYGGGLWRKEWLLKHEGALLL